jgi:hypothetical protein
MSRRRGRRPGDMTPERPARAGDRWIVKYHPVFGNWYTQPRAIGVWATRTRPQLFFPTLIAAGDYARGRASGTIKETRP